MCIQAYDKPLSVYSSFVKLSRVILSVFTVAMLKESGHTGTTYAMSHRGFLPPVSSLRQFNLCQTTTSKRYSAVPPQGSMDSQLLACPEFWPGTLPPILNFALLDGDAFFFCRSANSCCVAMQ